MRFPMTTEAYAARVARVCGANLVAHWPLDEASGATANDVSGNARHGAYTGVDLNRPGVIGTAPYFDGVNDFVNLYSAGLAAAFSPTLGSAFVWLRMANAAVWADATYRDALSFGVDVGNRVVITKSNMANVVYVLYSAGGTATARSVSRTDLGWMCVALSWSKAANEVRVYVNGAQQGATLTGLGVWAGAIIEARTRLGGGTLGWQAHGGLSDRVLTPAEMAVLGVIA